MSEGNGRTERRFRPLGAALLALVVAAGSGSAFADKLVVFKNGKTLRAKSIKEEKGWSRFELEGGSMVGVRTSLVQGIEDASPGTTAKSEPLPNQASVGGGGGGGGGYAPQPYQPQQEAAEAQDDFQQAPAEAQPPPQSSPGVAITPNTGRQPFGGGRGNRFNQNRNNTPNIPGVNFPGNVRQPVSNNQGGLRGNLRNNNLGQNNNNNNNNLNQDDDE